MCQTQRRPGGDCRAQDPSTVRGESLQDWDNSGAYPSKENGVEEIPGVKRQGFLALQKNCFTYERSHLGDHP